MIKTIIFDIGNVLTGFDWEPYLAKFGYDDEVLAKIKKATVLSPAWNEYDRGAISSDEVLRLFIQNDPSIEKELRECLSNINGILTGRDYAIPWIKELKQKGLQVLVLSNFSEKAYEDCQDVLDFLPYTDGGILSYRDKVIKPDPAIYQLLIDRYQLDPTECVFTDDLQRNLDGAAAFGIKTVLFTTYEEVIDAFKALGI